MVTGTYLRPLIHLTVLTYHLRYMHRGILFDDLANSVWLTHKYNVDGVLQDLLHMLHHIYPHEFKPWEEDVPAANADAIVAVNLARLTNTPCILPSAFYLCSQLDINILWAGRIRRDGVVDTLSTEDLKRCVAGKVKLAMHNVQNIEKIVALVANVHCATSTRCKSSRKQLRSYCIADALLLEYDPGALASWKDQLGEGPGSRPMQLMHFKMYRTGAICTCAALGEATRANGLEQRVA